MTSRSYWRMGTGGSLRLQPTSETRLCTAEQHKTCIIIIRAWAPSLALGWQRSNIALCMRRMIGLGPGMSGA